MSHATYYVGDVFDVLPTLDTGSVNCIITSPPYLAKRAYLPADHPKKAEEIGTEPTPGDFLATLLRLTDELWRVLADDGTMFINLGDTASGSGGAGGDYAEGGLREGQPAFHGSAKAGRWGMDPDKEIKGRGKQYRAKGNKGTGWPRAKSVCWIPELFGASLAYGRNLLTGEPCQQWITRPSITWCKPNPPVGEIIDKFREATELIVFAVKQPRYYFDLDAVREPNERVDEVHRTTDRQRAPERGGSRETNDYRKQNPLGAPPKNWWPIASQPYSGAHHAVFPPNLITRPVIAGCPPGGTILDPFAGSGTTLMVATGHGRNAIGIDLDERNADLARERVGMFLTVVDTREAKAS